VEKATLENKFNANPVPQESTLEDFSSVEKNHT
jgi:hypothetical protein